MHLLELLKGLFTSAPRVEPPEGAARVSSGKALLIDVREPDEWREGVVDGAVQLPLSDLAGARAKWTPFLAAVADRELLVYCGAGVRAGMAARVLAREGFRAANAGSFAGWKSAGLPVVKPVLGGPGG